MSQAETKDELELLEEKRQARKAALEKAARAQKAKDLAAIDALECELGDNCVEVVEIPYSDGLPVLLAVQLPSRPEIKRYQSRIKGAAQQREIDAPAASEELGKSAWIYPPKGDEALRDAIVAKRAGVLTTLGNAALRMSQGQAASEKKG